MVVVVPVDGGELGSFFFSSPPSPFLLPCLPFLLVPQTLELVAFSISTNWKKTGARVKMY